MASRVSGIFSVAAKLCVWRTLESVFKVPSKVKTTRGENWVFLLVEREIIVVGVARLDQLGLVGSLSILNTYYVSGALSGVFFT